MLAGILFLSTAATAIARADDCTAKLSAEQSKTYASLSPANQQLMTRMKNKDGSPATCDFRVGLLEILAHYAPQDRDAGFQELLKHTFVKQD
jgi:hypothetical protein